MEYNRTCNFYLERKRRKCNMLVKAGREYCGQHLVADRGKEGSSQYKRIPCPLDPKHSCFEHRLEHHVAVCNARSKGQVTYVDPDCNLRVPTLHDLPKITIAALSDDQLLSFLSRVKVAHSEHVGSVEVDVLRHEVVETVAGEVGRTVPGGTRHSEQNSSLLAHLRHNHLLHTSHHHTCYLEFGAGRGQLTHWLTHSVTDPSRATFLLVDRGAQRYKCDAKMKYNDELSVRRLRVDIKDLSLAAVPGLDHCIRLVAVGKHLCGAATDLALQCVSQYHGSGKAEVVGVVLALCCHHRCTWPTYVNPGFFQESGFSANEFYTLTSLTSWATCNPKRKTNGQGDSKSEVEDEDGGVPREEKNVSEVQEKEKNDGRVDGKVQEDEKERIHEENQREEDNKRKDNESILNNGEVISKGKESNSMRKSQEGEDQEGEEEKREDDDDIHTSTNTDLKTEKTTRENRYARLGLSASDREEAGRLAKQLLDEGRARFLRSLGFNARLIQYVERHTTPENVALVAWRTSEHT
ncbi:hypothetical protein Pcinc_005855 [Petrolisthes cinctipes]|uniref:tRNA:m(4)X modification enzyme TRM13 n=1 Tax=Petrolisthes cinctipes TaxID=88211 RepID=A0AAE1GE40_PETCI|nr:hypothetical protein Pcinc_005855 [Petrolisthes cinctipes]